MILIRAFNVLVTTLDVCISAVDGVWTVLSSDNFHRIDYTDIDIEMILLESFVICKELDKPDTWLQKLIL